jgi:hypothetical protein
MHPHVVIATTPERRARLAQCLDALRASTAPFVLVVYENLDGGCVPATRRAIAGLTGEVFLLNDDMIVEPDCLERLQASFRENFPLLDGACQPDDNYQGGQLGVSPYLHTETLRPFLRGYTHYFWDTELTAVLKGRGKFLTVPGARLDHQHVTRGAPNDETYQRTAENFARDLALFRQREAAGFPAWGNAEK